MINKSPILEVGNIHVFYGLFEAVKGVTFEAFENETVALIGPNGHGKSTILKTISGLLTPSSGKIIFYGKRIDKLNPLNIVKMGMVQVPEGGHLFSEMNVMENLLLGAYIPEAWKRRHNNLERVFQLFPILKERKDQLASTLSGGERRALAIGRGLMSSAKFLMLDEPTLGLAPKLSEEVMMKIREIRKDISMILVEENIRFVSELADRIYLIEKGKVTLQGTCNEILNNSYVKKTYLGM